MMSSEGASETQPGDEAAILAIARLRGRRRPSSGLVGGVDSRALLALARVASRDLPTILQRLAELVVELCDAGSAGVSLLDDAAAEGPIFRWAGVGGAWAPYLGGTMPRHASPCGTVVDRNAVLLIEDLVRIFPAAADLQPPPTEALLSPFHVDGQPVGTVWAVAHNPDRKFGLEDSEVLARMAGFAAAAHRGRITDALISAIAEAGDRKAFARLFEQIAPRLNAYLRGRGCAAYEAEEILQEAMLAVWRKAHQFDPRRASAQAWILGIVRNLWVDAYRRSAGERSLQPYELELIASHGDWLDPMRSSYEMERALAALPAPQMAVIRATFIEQRTQVDIAEALGVPLGTVKSRLRLALRRLKTELQTAHVG